MPPHKIKEKIKFKISKFLCAAVKVTKPFMDIAHPAD